ncbi:MAG: hypothetical protein QXP60_00420 [Nitrososphaerota archaeon]
MRRSFRDKDFIEDFNGMFFCVIGNVHPSDRVISYLKYIPKIEKEATRIKWSKEGKTYSRILPYYSALGTSFTKDYLKKKFPEYVYFDEYLNIEYTGVPIKMIKNHFKPEEKLRELLIEKNRDELEEIAIELVKIISNESNVSYDSIGISGSILLKIHNIEFSDIDLIIYGYENSIKVKETIKKILLEEKYGIHSPKGKILESWAKDIIKIHPLSFKEAYKLYSEKWNRILFGERQFSIHPVKNEKEVNEVYGKIRYVPKGFIKIKCTVEDCKEAIFLPCKYKIKNVEVIEGLKVNDIKEIVSYEGLYSDIAENEEEIVAYGKLEEVIDIGNNLKYHRVQIGSIEAKGKDYIKPLRWLLE